MPRTLIAVLMLSLLISPPVFAMGSNDAREELEQLNIPFTSEELIGRAGEGDAAAVRLLLAAGMEPNVRGKDTWTPLMHAADKGHTGVVRILLDNGADMNARNSNGDTAFLLAVKGEHEETAKVIGVKIAYTETGVSKLAEQVRRNECANNLKHLGLSLRLFAAENKERFPRVDDVKGNFMFEGDLLYPGYLRDLTVLGCPGDSGYQDKMTFRLKNNSEHPKSRIGDVHPDCITCESYVYLGWMVTNENEGLDAISAYLASSPDEFEKGFIVRSGRGNLGSDCITRLSLRIDRFLLSDVNVVLKGSPSPASEIPVLWEWPTNHGDGGNVLYLDGHVEFVSYPGKFPMTEKFIEALRNVEISFSEDIPPIVSK